MNMVGDLSTIPDDGLELILCQVPTRDLLRNCILVSRQWKRVLDKKYFWQQKGEREGYRLEWRRLSSLSLDAYKNICAQRPFLRNFVRDNWDLTRQNVDCFQRDSRWTLNDRLDFGNNPNGARPGIEVPPVFFDPLNAIGIMDEEVVGCLATSYHWFQKRIIIKLADEGLTNEIMDSYRPTIVVSELVSNRKDCACVYEMSSRLSVDNSVQPFRRREFHRFFEPDEEVQQNNRPDRQFTQLSFAQWEDEGWRRVEHAFRDYPAGMRYLIVECSGRDLQFWAGNYGSKMANCGVQALCQSNKERDNPNS